MLPSSLGFVAMLTAYRPTGGTARSEDLGRLLENRPYGDSMSLTRLVDAGEVFGFEWRNAFWIPMFQFDLRDLSVKPGPRKVLAEFAGVLNGWALASWFAEPNTWLNGARPVDKIDADLTAVVDAARTDRFIAAG